MHMIKQSNTGSRGNDMTILCVIPMLDASVKMLLPSMMLMHQLPKSILN